MPEASSTVDLDDVRRLLAGVISDADAIARLQGESPLRGTLPDLDSLAVAHLLLAIEERHGVVIDIEDVDDEIFATPNTLRNFVQTLVDRRYGGSVRRLG